MKILDLSAGKRAMWFDASREDTLHIDIRSEMKPDMVCSSMDMVRKVGDRYNLIVFDPPHVNLGANSEMSKQYGHFTLKQIRILIKETAHEAHKVSSIDALMVFKWNNHDLILDTVLELLSDWWEPLLGHTISKHAKSSNTIWVLLKRK